MNPPPDQLAALARVSIVLDHPRHPGNIGAAARALKTMGLSSLRLVAPQRFPAPEAEALASGALDVLNAAQVHETLDQALAGCVLAAGLTARSRELGPEWLDARSAAQRLLETAATQPVAVVFGNETYGLSNVELAQCQLMVGIPANPAYPSLNLAAAVQVLCYELRMAALSTTAEPCTPPELAPLEDIERFYTRLEQTLVDIDFLDPAHPKRLMPRLRRLFGRARLEREELNILMGVLKQIHKTRTKVD